MNLTNAPEGAAKKSNKKPCGRAVCPKAAICGLLSLLIIAFYGAGRLSAFDLVVFDNDAAYLGSQYYLQARHYEVNKVINIDNTGENRILAPSSLKYDKKYNRLLVGDYLSGRIRKYSLNNFKYAGDFEIETPGKKIMGNPSDIFISADGRRYVVTDQFFHRIVFFNSLGMMIDVMGSTGEAAGEFSEPCAIDYAGGFFFVADKYNCRICVYNQRGAFKYSFASKGSADSQLYLPSAVKAASSNEVFVCDGGNDRIQVFDLRGKHLKTIGRRGRSAGFFDAPSDICFDSNSNLYVADLLNKRVQKFTRDGGFVCEISALGSSFLADDYRPAHYFKMPGNYGSNEINFSLGALVSPLKIDVNNETAHLYVLDSAQKKIFVLDCDNFNKGRRLYLDHNFKDAIKYLGIVMEENPHNLNALYYLGFSYQQVYEYKKARDCYEKIIKYRSMGDVEKHARYQLKKIMAAHPPGYFDTADEEETLVKKRAEYESSYGKYFQAGGEATAFDRRRLEYFAKYGIKPPSTVEVKVEYGEDGYEEE